MNDNPTTKAFNNFLDKINQDDVCIITAYSSGCTEEENQKRNTDLFHALYRLPYTITTIQGSLLQADKEINNYSFVVASQKKEVNFQENIIKLAKKFHQDNILFITKDDNQVQAVFYDIGLNKEVDFLEQSNKVNPDFIAQLANSKFIFEPLVIEKRTKNKDSTKVLDKSQIFYPNNITSVSLRSVDLHGRSILKECEIDFK